ncbi:MAG: hypothetical protein E7399_04285 [Ruminococcaceae bacterium]|nr:hypothetical protein [Oscillospiraceae bacterium]
MDRAETEETEEETEEPQQPQVFSELYVSLDGNDENDGSIDAPFATLEKARDTIRQLKNEECIPDGGITVYVREGTYYPQASFKLTTEDSGTKEKPITYSAYPGEKVVISGGKTLDWSKFEPVSGEMKDKLRSKEAKDKVVVASLEELGMVNPGKYDARQAGYSAPMVLFDGELMQLSRYPNSNNILDWMLCDILNRGYCARYPADDYRQGEGLMKMTYKSDIIDSWNHNVDDFIYAGYWAETWYCEFLYGKLDKENKTMEALGQMLYGGANQYTVGANNGIDRSFLVYNVYEEIDEPGEWYIDRHAGMFYMYPKTDAENPVVKVTSLNQTLIDLSNVSYVTVKGMQLTSSRQNGITMTGGNNVVIQDCEIDSCEKIGVVMTGGTENGVIDCKIHHIGTNFMTINSCGNRDTLTHCNNYVTNNEMYDFALLVESSPGIKLNDCVGVTVDHNEIYNGPHAAIWFGGSENVMEYNVIREVVKNVGDVGSIYTGRDWRDHGNVVRYNHFINLGSNIESNMRPCGFFADDANSDTDIYGNVYGPGLDYTQANKIHAGQYNKFYNNLFIDTPSAYYSYIWSNDKWLKYMLGEQVDAETVASYHDKINQVNKNPLYLVKWPWLANTTDKDSIYYDSNTFAENLLIYVNNKPASGGYVQQSFAGETHILYGYDDVQTNTVLYDKNKELFADFDGGDYTLVPSAYPENFPEIPFAMIGRMDESDYEKQMSLAKDMAKNTVVGTNLGEYSEEMVETLKAAIEQAEDMSYLDAIALLQAAMDEVKASRITKATATEKNYTLPELLEGGELETGNVKDGFTLNLSGELGKTLVTGSFGETAYSMELSSGTEITPQQMHLSSPEENSFGTKATGEVVLNIGTSATVFSKPVRMVLTGMGKKRVFAEKDGKLATMTQMKEDSAEALKDRYGYLRSENDLIVWLKQGGEIVLCDSLVLPTVTPTPTPTKPAGGTTSGGGGTSGGSVSVGGSSGGSVSSGGTSVGSTSTPKPVYQSKFTDIIGHWAEKDINTMAEKEIVSGVTETTFEPDRNITRAEFAALVVRSLKISTTEQKGIFKDVSNDAWYAQTVATAAAAGLISGHDGYFRPDDTITREEMAVVMMKAYSFLGKEIQTGELNRFEDEAQISAWAKEAVGQAVGVGLISGMSESTFAPKASATRAQATSLLKRLLEQ